MVKLKLFLPPLFFGGVFIVVVLNVSPPSSLTTASISQLLLFFIPLFFLLTFTINIYFSFFIRSIIISLGITLLLIFKSLAILNLVSTVLTISAVIFLVISFKKPAKTPPSKIERLHLKKQH